MVVVKCESSCFVGESKNLEKCWRNLVMPHEVMFVLSLRSRSPSLVTDLSENSNHVRTTRQGKDWAEGFFK